MRVEDLREVETPRGKRAEAEIVWEDNDLPTRTLWFETEAPFADTFHASPEGFLLACAPLASWFGERRLRLDGPVCSVLHENARSVGVILHAAYPRLRAPRIEVARGVRPTVPRSPERTGMFLSGGVDALAVLRTNRLACPLDHPGAVREAFLVFGLYGFDQTEEGPVPERLAAWEDLRARMAGLAERNALTLVPVFTNVRTFSPDYLVWSRVLFSPLTASCVHGFDGRVSTVLMGSDGVGIEPDDVSERQTFSQCFSSAALEVRLELVHLDRGERIALLADWDEARALVQPCHHAELPAPGQVNCGRCEKCLRTMLGFLVLGRLGDTPAFAEDDVNPEWIEKVWLPSHNKVRHLAAFVDPLRRIGRRDLARAIRRRERKWRRKGR